jgi:hypothetical protein
VPRISLTLTQLKLHYNIAEIGLGQQLTAQDGPERAEGVGAVGSALTGRGVS